MRSKRFLKFAAVIPAIVLVGGFVGCKSGAFEMFSKPEPLPEPPAASPTEPVEKKPVFMPGSKSINLEGITIGLTPADAPPPEAIPPRP